MAFKLFKSKSLEERAKQRKDAMGAVVKDEIKQEILEEVMAEMEEMFAGLAQDLSEMDLSEFKEELRGLKGEDGISIEGDRGLGGDKGDKGDRGDSGRDGLDGRDGSDGKDGRDADETQIIFDVLKRIPKPKDSKPGRDGSPDTGAQIVQKINALPETSDKQIDVSHIKNLISLIKKYAEVPALGRRTGGGGITIETPTGTVNGVNATFDVTMSPKYLVIDSVSKFEGIHYTITNSRITIIDGSPPVTFIRAIV